MEYGVCPVSIAPMRIEPSDRSEMVNQVLFAECFKILESRKKWVRIRLAHDKYEGWLDRKQCHHISESEYKKWEGQLWPMVAHPVDILLPTETGNPPLSLVQGTPLPFLKAGKFTFAGRDFTFTSDTLKKKTNKKTIPEIAFTYLNAPYLWGGRTPFGIDCSGFTQMVYRQAGSLLPRDASEQAKLGQVLSFIEEAEPGDLAFFDNEEGKIIHVGILLKDNYIIHASGKVRLDRLDQTGIYNPEERQHTHRLRVIKKVI